MPNIRAVYLDSCVFLSVISPVYHRLPSLVPVLDLIDAGKLIAVTSAFTIVEVRKYKDEMLDLGYIDGAQAARVRQMFDSGKVIIRPITEFVAFRAAEIGNNYPDLLPADCLHVASAEFDKVDVLFTFDGEGKHRRNPQKMLHYDGLIGPSLLRIAEPFVPMGELFDREKLGAGGQARPAFKTPSELDARSVSPGTAATE
jgi:predicted nucleic acid-binding protein